MTDIKTLLKTALLEDVPSTDVSADLVYQSNQMGTATITAKQAGIFFGSPVINPLLHAVDDTITVDVAYADGDAFLSGDTLLRLSGPVKSLLIVERTLLNFLQRLCGIASITNAYIKALNNPDIAIVDTRKTTPTLRALEKQAVLAGGGYNHRHSLSDMVLLKENHLAALTAAGQIQSLSERLQSFKLRHPNHLIEVEVQSIDELQTLDLKHADIIMFDNFEFNDIRPAVDLCRQKNYSALIEISGNITLDTIHWYAELPIDRIAIGRLTHSVPAIDLSMGLS